MEWFTEPVALHSLQLLSFLRQGRNILSIGMKTNEDMKGRNIADLNDFNIEGNKQMKEERKKKNTATLKKTYMMRMGK